MLLKNKQAFTMIEIMLVVIIIGILAAILVPNLAGRGEKARVSAAKADIVNLDSALSMYELDNGRYPSTDQGLKALLEEPGTSLVSGNWSGPYLKKKQMPKDPWGKEYIYVSPGNHNTESYDLSSYGHDGIESKDDIINWSEEEESGS